MNKYRYECDDCEDIEESENLHLNGFICECGGHYDLLLRNHYELDENIPICNSCKNRQSNKCNTCDRV